jgi:hypothetical protein
MSNVVSNTIITNPDVIMVESVIVSDNASISLATTAAASALAYSIICQEQAAIATAKALEASESSTSAATSATDAATSATDAATAATEALAAVDEFGDLYLGTKSTAPTLDNDGDALVSGALYFDSTTTTMRVWDGTNWIATSGTSAVSLNTYRYIATAGQTTFSGVDYVSSVLSYTPASILVTLNGVMLGGSDYTASDGTSIVMASPVALSDELVVVAFVPFAVLDTYTKSETDALLVSSGIASLNNNQIFIGDINNQTSVASFDSLVDARAIALAIALG